MARCPFANWKPITGPSGSYTGGPAKIVHHTTEGHSANDAFKAFKRNRSDPHFTVDARTIYQHIDTSSAARALRNEDGGVQTNRDSAIQIELVGFAGAAKDRAALRNVARLCRWLEEQHRIPAVWPSGRPKPARNGRDPNGHNRDAAIWDARGGHYGHSQVPENVHWDPAYTAEEADYMLAAQFDENGKPTNPEHPAVSALQRSEAPRGIDPQIIEDHADVGAAAAPRRRRTTPPSSPVRTYDALPDTIDFRDAIYSPSLIRVSPQSDLDGYRAYDLPVLDQGAEGACTGFALAAVANYLIRVRGEQPQADAVSAQMLYTMAKRYDEWPGEDYEGSSARGAMKGWYKHGLCAERLWKDADPDPRYTGEERSANAIERPLGAYYRVNHRDLVAMHAAINDVGVLFATASVHRGWEAVQPGDREIVFEFGAIGGHAFAIVGYDRDGLWIQNSWGTGWGDRGLARMSYADWLANGTDVWVAALGAPMTLAKPLAGAPAATGAQPSLNSQAYSALRAHIVTSRNDGVLDDKGAFGLTKKGLHDLMHGQVSRTMSNWAVKRFVLYAHGGLVSEDWAVRTVAANRDALLQANVYPLSFIWRSDVWSTIGNILGDVRARRSGAGLVDFMADRFDDMLEPMARHFGGKSLWDEMKENAVRASAADNGSARLVAGHIAELSRAGEIDEVHLVGHSAGSIFHAPFANLLHQSGVRIKSLSLWAPACTMRLFETGYRPLIDSGAIEAFDLYLLDDATEQEDDCADIYHKSLLYLVSRAFEEVPRIVGRMRRGTALLGLERDVNEALSDLWNGDSRRKWVAPGPGSRAVHHGDFDDDALTLATTLSRILGEGGSHFRPQTRRLTSRRTGSEAGKRVPVV